jgi:hypothetical protein
MIFAEGFPLFESTKSSSKVDYIAEFEVIFETTSGDKVVSIREENKGKKLVKLSL